jgi:hypothetical protein
MVATIGPYACWVEYWNKAENHGHMLLIKNDDEPLSMNVILGDIEEYADELAGMFLKCDNERHKGKAHKHSPDTPKLAYEAAVFQLLTVDYSEEWEEIQRKMRAHKKWNGTVPAMVMMPSIDDPKDWQAVIPNSEGDPYLYPLRKGILDDILDPRDSSTPNEYGLGWTLKKRRN